MFRLVFTISILLILLAFRFFFFYHNQPTYIDGQKLNLQTTLLSEPTQTGKYQRITARLPKGDRVFISVPSYPEYTYSQTLEVQGKLQIKEGDQGTIYTMSYPKIQVIQTNNVLLRLIAPIRSRIVGLFDTSLPQPAGNLLLGIVFGIQKDMPKSFDDALQTAGVLHVIAASGMNVTIIGGFLAYFFGRIVRRQYALVLTTLGIIFYAGLAGFSASIVRASIMGILVFSAQILGRQTLALYGLLLAGFFMLIFQPFLLFDTGFQLSFMATWGLIVFNPLMSSVMSRKGWLIDLVGETDFLTTFIAQLVTLPVLLGTFGNYSPVSIFVNFLVLWTIPILMIIGGLGTMVGLLLPILGQWILYLALPFLYYFESVVWVFGSLPITLSVESISWQIVLGYYLLLLSFLLSSRASAKRSHQIASSQAPRYDKKL